MEKAETIRKIEKMAITVGSSRAESRGEVEEEEMDDEEFMRMYRQKRLAEMQQAQRYRERWRGEGEDKREMV